MFPAAIVSTFGDANPQVGPKFARDPFGKRVLWRILAQHGENRRARAGHERAFHFGLGEEPRLQVREKKMFLENRALEIVDQRAPGKALSAVRNALDFAGIAPARIGPGRRHAEGRLDEHQSQGVRKIDGFDDLSPAPDNRGRLVNEKRDVGSELRGHLDQRLG